MLWVRIYLLLITVVTNRWFYSIPVNSPALCVSLSPADIDLTYQRQFLMHDSQIQVVLQNTINNKDPIQFPQKYSKKALMKSKHSH